MRRLFISLTALGLCSAPAMAQEGALIGSVLQTLGITPSEAPVIDYKERPALVVPKNKNALPPPQDLRSSRGANWPVEPEEIERRRQAERYNDQSGRPRAMSPASSRPGIPGTPGVASRPEARSAIQPEQPSGPALHEIFIGSFSRKDKAVDETIPFTGEQPRSSLTEPPPSYRTPAKNAPYGPRGLRPIDPNSAQQKAGRGQ